MDVTFTAERQLLRVMLKILDCHDFPWMLMYLKVVHCWALSLKHFKNNDCACNNKWLVCIHWKYKFHLIFMWLAVLWHTFCEALLCTITQTLDLRPTTQLIYIGSTLSDIYINILIKNQSKIIIQTIKGRYVSVRIG